MIQGFWSVETITFLAGLVTIIGLPFAIIGLFAVAKQMRNDRLAVSAAAIGEMRSTIITRIERLHATHGDEDVNAWTNEFAEFANELEMACAIYLDGQLSGRTGELAKDMICDFLNMINEDDDLRGELERAIHSPNTFKNIRDFRAQVR
ncbi:hypothetical protein [Rhizobium sp. PAMB 3182]